MSITTVKTAEQETEAGMKKHGNRGNFANDPIRAREAGRKGGKARSTRQNDRT